MCEVVRADSNDLETYRKEAKEAARDLCYGTLIIQRIHKAKTFGEIERIMIAARHNKEYF